MGQTKTRAQQLDIQGIANDMSTDAIAINDIASGLVNDNTAYDTLYADVALTNISKEINTNTIVDVFIYDTTNDADNGEWIKSSNWQSWVTETLGTTNRGLNPLFPEIALVVAEVDKIIIYDATQFDCPMWMVFNVRFDNMIYSNGTTYPVTSVYARNGKLYVTSGGSGIGGLSVVDFINDSAYYKRKLQAGPYKGNIAERDSQKDHTTTEGNNLIDDVCYKVKVTKDNTVFVSTEVGINVILANDTIFNSTFNTAVSEIMVDIDNVLYFNGIGSSNLDHTINYKTNSFTSTQYNSTVSPAIMPSNITALTGSYNIYSGSSIGLTILYQKNNDESNGMVSYHTNLYYSGIMQGNIQAAYLANSPTINRSLSNVDLIMTGIVNEIPIVPGAELQIYTGFDVNNYLEVTDPQFVDTLYCYGWVEDPILGWRFRHGVVNTLPIDGVTISGNTLHIEGTLPKTLLRFTTTIPTNDQLILIERLEYPLFFGSMRCLLQDDNSNIIALSFDESIDTLAICTNNKITYMNGVTVVKDNIAAVTSISTKSNKEITGA